MPINNTHVGRSYQSQQPYQVSRAKIAEFATAIGDRQNPAYQGDSPIAPPTFAVVIAANAWDALFNDAELGIQLAGTVHADQRFELNRPLRAGDEVLTTTTIDKLRLRGATAMITVAVKICSLVGEEICTCTSQLICQLNQEGQDA